MKDDNRMEFAAIPIVVVILGVLFAVMIFAEFGVWGWVVFGVISAAAVVIVAVILARRPTHASELDASTTSTRRAAEPDGTYKVVLVCDDSCIARVRRRGRRARRRPAARGLRRRARAGLASLAWTGDDAARGVASEHLGATLRALETAGVAARGETGAHDPIRAADDALREFPADEVVFATHPEADANWLEQNVLQARTRYDVPVTHVVVGKD